MENKVLIGADPEFFLIDTKTNKHVSAHGLVPGDKRNPYTLRHGAVQLDGTAVEFNISPASTAEEFSFNIRHTLEEIRLMVPTRYKFDFSPAVVYDAKYFDSIPNDCKVLGCDPDYDAIRRGKVNNPPAAKKSTLRTGAGHIHIGWTHGADPFEKSHFEDCIMLNTALFNYFNFIKYEWDWDQLRSQLYGYNAAFRPKPYGTEFRTLSNAWVPYPKLHKYIFDSAQYIFKGLTEGTVNTFAEPFYNDDFDDYEDDEDDYLEERDDFYRDDNDREWHIKNSPVPFPRDWKKEILT